jgi:NADH:ubiquinone oxidoreductase subunit E
MENQKKEIVICLGSSCFARGNKAALKVISDYMKEHNLQNDVTFHGQRCFGQCAKGPMLKFGDAFHENTDPEIIIKLLEEYLRTI